MEPSKDPPMIEVRVGRDEHIKSFYVHESLICSRSLVFKKAMAEHWNNSGLGSKAEPEFFHWKEGGERVVTLPEETPQIVELYFDYLYTGKISVSWFTPKELRLMHRAGELDAEALDDRCDQSAEQELELLCELYVLCEFLQDVKGKNKICRTLHKAVEVEWPNGYTYSPEPRSIRFVYDRTTENSPMRRLLLDVYLKSRVSLARKDLDVIPKAFLFDLFMEWKEINALSTERKHASEYYEDEPISTTNGPASHS